MKRNVPSSSTEPSTATSPQKQRRLVRADLEVGKGDETVKRRTVNRVVTPKERQNLDRDDFETDKSPARRLFADGGKGSG